MPKLTHLTLRWLDDQPPHVNPSPQQMRYPNPSLVILILLNLNLYLSFWVCIQTSHSLPTHRHLELVQQIHSFSPIHAILFSFDICGKLESRNTLLDIAGEGCCCCTLLEQKNKCFPICFHKVSLTHRAKKIPLTVFLPFPKDVSSSDWECQKVYRVLDWNLILLCTLVRLQHT